MKIKKIQQSSGYVGNVIDSLENESQIDALSARQGKILKEQILANTVDFAETENNNSIDGIRIMRNEEIVNYANWQVMNPTLVVCVLDENFISTIVNETATVLNYFTGIKLSDLSSCSSYGSLYYYFLIKDGSITNLKPTMPIQEMNGGHYYNIIRYATITEDASAQTITFNDLGAVNTGAVKNIVVDWLTLNGVDSLLPTKGSNRITYTPKNENHPATKKYVDDLIASQKITFIMSGNTDITYTALRGMTWRDWIQSEYNTDGYYITTSGNYISSANGNFTFTYVNDKQIYPWEVISNGETYYGAK